MEGSGSASDGGESLADPGLAAAHVYLLDLPSKDDESLVSVPGHTSPDGSRHQRGRKASAQPVFFHVYGLFLCGSLAVSRKICYHFAFNNSK